MVAAMLSIVILIFIISKSNGTNQLYCTPILHGNSFHGCIKTDSEAMNGPKLDIRLADVLISASF